MTIKINVTQAKSPTIKIKTVAGGGLQATAPTMVVANLGALPIGVDRYDNLTDVVEASPANGAVGVYNAATDKYEVKQLDFDFLVGDINNVDGGSF